jgi:hypothetical protein
VGTARPVGHPPAVDGPIDRPRASPCSHRPPTCFRYVARLRACGKELVGRDECVLPLVQQTSLAWANASPQASAQTRTSCGRRDWVSKTSSTWISCSRCAALSSPSHLSSSFLSCAVPYAVMLAGLEGPVQTLTDDGTGSTDCLGLLDLFKGTASCSDGGNRSGSSSRQAACLRQAGSGPIDAEKLDREPMVSPPTAHADGRVVAMGPPRGHPMACRSLDSGARPAEAGEEDDWVEDGPKVAVGTICACSKHCDRFARWGREGVSERGGFGVGVGHGCRLTRARGQKSGNRGQDGAVAGGLDCWGGR